MRPLSPVHLAVRQCSIRIHVGRPIIAITVSRIVRADTDIPGFVMNFGMHRMSLGKKTKPRRALQLFINSRL